MAKEKSDYNDVGRKRCWEDGEYKEVFAIFEGFFGEQGKRFFGGPDYEHESYFGGFREQCDGAKREQFSFREVSEFDDWQAFEADNRSSDEVLFVGEEQVDFFAEGGEKFPHFLFYFGGYGEKLKERVGSGEGEWLRVACWEFRLPEIGDVFFEADRR